MTPMAVCPCGEKFFTEERDLVAIGDALRADGWTFGDDRVWRCRKTTENLIRNQGAKAHRASERRAKKREEQLQEN